jgi:hypothetical protein
VIGRFPGETGCLSLCWAVLELVLASSHGPGLTDLDRRHLARLAAARTPPITEDELRLIS